jgi:trigger factor
MQSIVKKISSNTVELTIKEAGKTFEKYYKSTMDELRKNITLKGFRKGSAPDEVILKEYGEKMVEAEVIQSFMDDNYQKVLTKENLIPTGPASIKAINSTNPIELILEVEILPEVTIDEKKLAKIKLKKTVPSVTPAEVDAEVSRMETKFVKFEDAANDATIEKGDKVTIDTQGFDKKGGIAIPETKVDAFPLIVGSGSFIPGFEEKLIGSKVGEVVEFDITFPADYHAEEFKSRKVFFITTIFKVEKSVKPEWTPEFIEKLRGKSMDFESFKKTLESEILHHKEHETRAADEDKLLEELKKITTVEIGGHLLAHEADRVYEEMKQDYEGQGIKMSDFLSHMKKTEEDYKEALKPQAERRLFAELALEKIKGIIKVEVSEEDINKEIEHVISHYSNLQAIDRLREMLKPGTKHYEDIENRLKYKKIIDTFFE